MNQENIYFHLTRIFNRDEQRIMNYYHNANCFHVEQTCLYIVADGEFGDAFFNAQGYPRRMNTIRCVAVRYIISSYFLIISIFLFPEQCYDMSALDRVKFDIRYGN